MEKLQIYNPLNLDGTQKVVQLNLENKMYLLYGESFHYKLLQSFLKKQNIEYSPIQMTSSLFPVLVPPLQEEGIYQVRGMGKASLYFSKKLYTGMCGSSEDYGIGINQDDELLFREILKNNSWKCI